MARLLNNQEDVVGNQSFTFNRNIATTFSRGRKKSNNFQVPGNNTSVLNYLNHKIHTAYHSRQG